MKHLVTAVAKYCHEKRVQNPGTTVCICESHKDLQKYISFLKETS